MVSALDKLKASLQTKYGEESAMSPNEMPHKGVVSSGSLSLDYMLGTFGIPRDIVMEIGGKPGVSKSTMSLSIINNVLKLEYERALKYSRVHKAAKKGELNDYDVAMFDRAYNRQEEDLHVFDEEGADKKNRIIDNYSLTEKECDYARKNIMRGAVYLDLEGRFDANWAKRFVDNDFLNDCVIVVRNDSMEEATDVYRDAVKTKRVAVVVVDSIGGAPSKQVVDKSSEKGSVGGNSGPVTRFANFADGLSTKYTCLTICINQVRDDMTGYHGYITPGGWGLKHACSIRIELKRKTQAGWTLYDIEPGTQNSEYECGFKVAANLRKTSVGRKGQACDFYFYTHDCKYGKAGFDRANEIINLAILSGQIEEVGKGYFKSKYWDKKIHGRDAVVAKVLSDEKIFSALYDDMKNRLYQGGIDGALSTFDEETGETIDLQTGEIS